MRCRIALCVVAALCNGLDRFLPACFALKQADCAGKLAAQVVAAVLESARGLPRGKPAVNPLASEGWAARWNPAPIEAVAGLVDCTDDNVSTISRMLKAANSAMPAPLPYAEAVRACEAIPGIAEFRAQVLLNNLALLGLAPTRFLRDAIATRGKNPHKLLAQLPQQLGTIEDKLCQLVAALGPGEHRRGAEDALCELVRFYSPKGMAKNWVYLPALAGLQMVLTQYGLLVPS